MDLLPIRPSNLVVIISMDLLPIQLGINYWSNWVEIHSFGGHNLNGFTPNSTGRIRPVEFGGHNLNGFTPNSTGH